MKITQAIKSDAPIILALQKQAYQSEAALHDDFGIPPLTQTLEQLLADFEQKTILKIEKDGELLASGQVQFEGDTCYIGRMAVWPQHQGKGLGSVLLTALENTFAEANHAELFTGELSESNLNMYHKRGYRPFKTAQLGKTKVVYLRRSLKG